MGVVVVGWLVVFNYVGYLSGVLVVLLISDLVLKDCLYWIGMVVVVFSMVVMGLIDNVVVWVLLCFVVGLSSVVGMFFGIGLIFNWLICYNYCSELGIYFFGIGIGIVGCVVVVVLMSYWLDWCE